MAYNWPLKVWAFGVTKQGSIPSYVASYATSYTMSVLLLYTYTLIHTLTHISIHVTRSTSLHSLLPLCKIH